MKIALLGTRGIPASYGGFETFAEEIAARLVQRGHQVTVYGRRKFFTDKNQADDFKSVQRRLRPTIMHKYLETPIHSLTSFCDLFGKDYDLILLCNAANSPFAFIAKILGLPLIINVDGIERMRSKWNRFGRAWYRLGEICSCLFATRIVADAQVIADYYKKTYKIESAVIAYGANPTFLPAGKILEKFNLQAKQYILYVSRLEPENNALCVIQAYSKLDQEVRNKYPLVIVGDAPYASSYKNLLYENAKNLSVIFTGYQFGSAYHELQSNCYMYIQATEVGGTHPALIESMSYGNSIIANATPENIEVLDNCGLHYQKNDPVDLAGCIHEYIKNPALAKKLGQKAQSRAQQVYNWEKITDQYEALFEQTC